MPHHWQTITLGRVCTECSVAQETGSYVEDLPCARDKPYDDKKPGKPRKPKKS